MRPTKPPPPLPLPRVSKAPPPEATGAVVTSAHFRAPEVVELDESLLEEIHELEVRDDAPAVVPPPTQPPTRASIPASAHKDPAAPAVLVVDDDPTIRAILVRALGLSYNVFACEDGQIALDLLARIPPPACIVSDWMMPHLDGVELAKRVRADPRLKRTPIIFLTAKNHPLDVVQGINAGARHYLAKPFKMKELLEKVAHVLAASATRK